MDHSGITPQEGISYDPGAENTNVMFGTPPRTISGLRHTPEFKKQTLERLFMDPSVPGPTETEDRVFSGSKPGTASKENVLEMRVRERPKQDPNLSPGPANSPPAPRMILEDFVTDSDEFLERFRERDRRNIERSALWHLLYTLSEGYRAMPLASLLLPDESKKGSASAHALVEYARRMGHGVRPPPRLAKIAIRLTRHRRPKEVRDVIRDTTEMGHSMQVQCLTRTAYNLHELEESTDSPGIS